MEFTIPEVVKALRSTGPTSLEFPRSIINEESFVVELDESTQMLVIEFTTVMPK